MRALLQKVSKAKVESNNQILGSINKGILLFLGIGKEDTEADVQYLVDKIINLRIFEDKGKPMDKSIIDIKGEILIISQFTLYGATKKGRRPDFGNAADPLIAKELYNKFIEACIDTGVEVQTGEFGTMMDVSLTNDGPVTFMIESNSSK